MFRSGRGPLRVGALCAVLFALAALASAQPEDSRAAFHDAHYHPTDYIQRESALPEFLGMMGDRVGRAALMGIPLQQKWDWFESGARAPDYYLRSDAALYYYPFVDAMVAEAVLALPPEQRARFDPMITGFNPTDMYAADHIRRVLRLYPGVFSGIGEFSIHKEVVSPKTVGHGASLRNPALDRILEFAGEVGLLTLIHNDVDVILPHEGERPTHLDAFVEVVRRHPGTTIVWAHAGIGRFVEPTPDYVGLLEEILRDDSLAHLHFDLSWDVVAEQIVGAEETRAAWVALVNAWPDRFIIGSDSVVAKEASAYLGALDVWKPLLDESRFGDQPPAPPRQLRAPLRRRPHPRPRLGSRPDRVLTAHQIGDRRSSDRHRQPEAGEPRGAEPSPRAVPAGALLELGEFQDLADLAPELGNLAAGYGLRYRVAGAGWGRGCRSTRQRQRAPGRDFRRPEGGVERSRRACPCPAQEGAGVLVIGCSPIAAPMGRASTMRLRPSLASAASTWPI